MGDGDLGGVQIGGWLEALASGSATPGGGSAAALAGALGAALVSMTGRLTLGRQAFEAVQQRVGEVVAAADSSRAAFLDLARRDAEGFEAVMAAFELPKETEEERLARSAAIQAAYAEAAEPPLQIARMSVRMLALAEEMAEMGNPSAVSDACSAAAMRAAASIAAAANVRINAAAIGDAVLSEALATECDDLESKAEAALARTRQAFAERIGS
jgi:glutamate formiminotransferase/formiminotetrahydrofolate cyclodeaminase